MLKPIDKHLPINPGPCNRAPLRLELQLLPHDPIGPSDGARDDPGEHHKDDRQERPHDLPPLELQAPDDASNRINQAEHNAQECEEDEVEQAVILDELVEPAGVDFEGDEEGHPRHKDLPLGALEGEERDPQGYVEQKRPDEIVHEEDVEVGEYPGLVLGLLEGPLE